MAEQNWAEELWKVYYTHKIKGKVLDLGRVGKIREAFMQGMHAGGDLVLKFAKLSDQRCVECIKEFRDQIVAALHGANVLNADIRTELPSVIRPGGGDYRPRNGRPR
jgi:hypothetical protein